MVLIKAVLSALPIFQVSVSVLPKGIKSKIHGLIGKFMWGGSEYGRKLHLVK